MEIKDLTILKSLVSKIMAMKDDSEWEDAINEVVREYIWERDGVLTEEEEDFTYDDIEKIVFNTIANQRKFKFTEKPLMYGCSNSEMLAIETKPAIRRQTPSQE